MNNVTEAIKGWRQKLGDKCVDTGPVALTAAGNTTFAAGYAPQVILTPRNTQQVTACVTQAMRSGIPLYTISRGRNWGFGSKACLQPGAALVDLSSMDQIFDFDDELGTLRIEPGVTFAQIDRFLKKQHAHFFLPVTGGPADASVIGNALERGEAFGAGGDRAGETYDYEVVLGCGDVIHTGFGRFQAAGATAVRVSRVHKRGVGANLSGLMEQSGFGIVTAATIALAPLSEFTIALSGEIGSGSERLSAASDALRTLVRDGIIAPYALSIWNKCKILARDQVYSDLDITELTPDVLDHWSASAAITAPNALLAEAKTRTAGLVLKTLLENTEAVRDTDELGRRVDSILTGTPDNRNLRSLYWRKAVAPEADDFDPDRDRCGALWLCPVVPFTGKNVAEAASIMTAMVVRHGFEANIGFHAVSDRCLHGFLALIYDREIKGEDDRAILCHDETARGLIEAGYLPYRQGLQGIPAMADIGTEAYDLVMERLKSALDPQGIMAPGRYQGFAGARPDRKYSALL